ncbi:MAG: Potassium channel [Geoglossum umbratile]|nr:MAG: Potassium channel [Geoglossum umbratile]
MNGAGTAPGPGLGDVQHPGLEGRSRFRMRAKEDGEPQDWWFASTAIPLLAATIGPLANLLSIAALVSPWRNRFPDGGSRRDAESRGFPDPHWCIILNACSLICGFAGNIFLLFNFARRVRYIIALPLTILLWYLATGILIAIIAAINNYVPPNRPQETYSQGFWYAIIAAVLYLFSSMILMVNMLGYFLGHYPQHFTLTDHQRTLMLQTMMFFIWLGGGGGVFARICGWSFADAIYFCDVTILTVGFGDLYPTNDAGRGLVFPFSVAGIVMLGLVANSIRRFTLDISQDKIIKQHVEKTRIRTIGRAATASMGIRERRKSLGERATSREQGRRATLSKDEGRRKPKSLTKRLTNGVMSVTRVRPKKPKIILLKEERNRFDAMREIQRSTKVFKRWYNLCISVAAFGLLWCVGAIVFWKAEHREQGMTYFQALYFCYVSLLTIGYGDLSPKSNAGKPFFVVWSLLAVPTMTILISDMGETVIASFQRGTFQLADWTVLPKAGLWPGFLERNPWILLWIQRKVEERAAEKRIAKGFQAGIDDADGAPKTLEELAQEGPNEQNLPYKLSIAIRRVAGHIHTRPPKRYSYEEWVEFTRLIRFSSSTPEEVEEDEEEEGLINWDWIGEDSPMLASQEAEWLLDRLCESLSRYVKRQARKEQKIGDFAIVSGGDGTRGDICPTD